MPRHAGAGDGPPQAAAVRRRGPAAGGQLHQLRDGARVRLRVVPPLRGDQAALGGQQLPQGHHVLYRRWHRVARGHHPQVPERLGDAQRAHLRLRIRPPPHPHSHPQVHRVHHQRLLQHHHGARRHSTQASGKYIKLKKFAPLNYIK
jgi:hypothetical protein